MFKLFNNLFKKSVTVDLDSNVSLTLEPTVGGVNAILEENGDIFCRREKAFFGTVEELIRSLRLTDEEIIKKLSKAF